MGEGEKAMSLPVKVTVNWKVMEVCNSCADKISDELTKAIRNRKPVNLDISTILCDDCWRHNVDNGAIRAELDPNVVRRRG